MSSDIWIGALISVPIGIGTGLAVTPIQKWMDARNQTRTVASMVRRKDEYRQVLRYLQNPNAFTQYLVVTAIRTTFVGSAVGIFSALLGAIYAGLLPEFRAFMTKFGPILLMGMQLVTVSSLIIIVRMCQPAIRLWYGVSRFDSYVKELPKELRDLEAERSVSHMAAQ